MTESTTSPISLEEYVLCIIENIPGAKFSAAIDGTDMHDISPSKLLYAKLGLPSGVMCCFHARPYFAVLIWKDNAVGILTEPYRKDNWNYIPDIIKKFRTGASLPELHNIVKNIKRYGLSPCLFAEALETKANTRLLWNERDD